MSSKLYASFFRLGKSLPSNRDRSNFWTRGNQKEREGKTKVLCGYVKQMDSAIHDAMSRAWRVPRHNTVHGRLHSSYQNILTFRYQIMNTSSMVYKKHLIFSCFVEGKRAWDAIEVEEPEPGPRKHERGREHGREGRGHVGIVGGSASRCEVPLRRDGSGGREEGRVTRAAVASHPVRSPMMPPLRGR